MSDKKCVNYTVVLSIIIALLLFIIGEIYYFSNKLTPNSSISTDISIDKNNNEIKDVANGEVEIIMITDKRCGDKCDVNPIISQLKQIPSLSNINIKVLDYSDDGAKDKLEKTGSKKLPIVLFNTNSISELSQFLKETNDGMYSLELGAEFDPLAKRSDKGFLVLDDSTLNDVKSNLYLKGKKDATITLIEYTDLNCFYCKKMEKDGTGNSLLKKFPNVLNKATSNFIGVGGDKTKKGAEILECIGKVSGGENYNTVLSKTLILGDSSEESIFSIAKDEGIDIDSVKKCFDAGEMKDMVLSKFNTGKNVFGVTGTPGNVLLNNETGEYIIISGAQPIVNFEEGINNLLK